MAVVTGTKTVTLNAAFMQEIKEDNQRLYALLEEVRTACSRRPATFVEPERLAERLAELRDQLALHFSLEEAVGYFDDPLDVAPEIGERAETLRSQHADLYREVVSIADCAEDMLSLRRRPSLRQLVIRARRFCRDLEIHEAEESDLMWTVYHRDIGGEG